MRTEKKWFSVLILAVVALLAISACAPAAPPPAPTPTKAPAAAPTPAAKAAAPTPAPAKPKELLKLKVATPHPGVPILSVPAIAEAMGYFKEEGLQVEFVYTKGGGDTVQAVQVPGGADVGYQVGPMSVLGAVEKGADLKIISAAVTPAIFYWIAAKDSPYKTVKDLAGKPVAYTSAGASSHLVLLAILEKEGVKAEPVAGGALTGMWTQVKTGQLAAAVVTAPEVWKLAEEEGAKVVIRVTDYPEFADYTFVINMARGDSFKNKPEAIKAFHRGMKKAADLIVKDPAAAAKAFKPNTELSEELLVRYYKDIPRTHFRLAPIGGMDISVKYAKEFKFITKDPDLSKIVDMSLVPQ